MALLSVIMIYTWRGSFTLYGTNSYIQISSIWLKLTRLAYNSRKSFMTLIESIWSHFYVLYHLLVMIDIHTLLGFPIALKNKYLLGYVVNLRDVDDGSSFFADYDQ